jgi:hypothetical protein
VGAPWRLLIYVVVASGVNMPNGRFSSLPPGTYILDSAYVDAQP